MSWISISFETMPKFCDANWTIQSQMVWLLRTECATMRIRIRVRIRFWSIRHLNVTKSKNLIPNFSLNQHNFESSSNHIRLPNMHIAHTHFVFLLSGKSASISILSQANALKLVRTMLCERFCDAIKWILNIDFVVETNTKTSLHRFCNHFSSEKWQSPFEYMYAYLTFDRVFDLHGYRALVRFVSFEMSLYVGLKRKWKFVR